MTDIDAQGHAARHPTHPTHRPAETRDVPEAGVWARLVRPDANDNADLPSGEHVLLAAPGRVEVVDRFPGGTLGLYRTARRGGGCLAPDAALVWLPAQAFARLSAHR
jgi:hypothetical protein